MFAEDETAGDVKTLQIEVNATNYQVILELLKKAIIFNRDMLLNETEVIDNCTKSVGLLSDETVIANHPWVDDPQAELDRLADQQSSQVEQYGNAFAPKLTTDQPLEETDGQ